MTSVGRLAHLTFPESSESDAEVAYQLSPSRYQSGSPGEGPERAFCGTLLDNKRQGVYTCICTSCHCSSCGIEV